MNTILQKGLGFLLVVLSFSALAEIQYQPLSSVKRHGFYLARPIEIKFGELTEDPFKKLNLESYAFKYDVYFPEIHGLFNNYLKDFIRVGFTFGAQLFQPSYSNIQNHCNSDLPEAQSLLYYGSLQWALTYLEYIQIFAEGGLAHAHCVSYKDKNFLYKKSHLNLKYHTSVGVFLSLKFIDHIAIYSLDEDYGINDIGIIGRCSWFMEELEEKTHLFCEAGLSIKI